VSSAVLTVFKQHCSVGRLADVVLGFDEGTVVHAGDDLDSAAYGDLLATIPALRGPAMELAGSESPAAVASATEFLLEGLHLSKRLNKERIAGRSAYRGR